MQKKFDKSWENYSNQKLHVCATRVCLLLEKVGPGKKAEEIAKSTLLKAPPPFPFPFPFQEGSEGRV